MNVLRGRVRGVLKGILESDHWSLYWKGHATIDLYWEGVLKGDECIVWEGVLKGILQSDNWSLYWNGVWEDILESDECVERDDSKGMLEDGMYDKEGIVSKNKKQ